MRLRKRLPLGLFIVCLFAFVGIALSAGAQTSAANQWTWMGGSSTVGTSGYPAAVYGTLGTPAAGNIPGDRVGAATWTDRNGNLWLFGGEAPEAQVNVLNDLWEFNPSTNEWAWMGGSSTVSCGTNGCGQSRIYGTLSPSQSLIVAWA